jgi:hypothetical protein
LIDNYKKSDINRLYFSYVSITGLFILFLLVLYAPSPKNAYSIPHQIILSIFILICLAGMVAAVSPSSCNELSSLKYDWKDGYVQKKFSGHHPECENFKTHTYTLLGKKYCAGCSGLFIGALIGVIGSIGYYFYGISVENALIIFFVGFFLVLMSLLQNFLLKVDRNLVKFILNLILVIGSFFLLIGTLELTNSLFIQLYFLVVVFIWILARISNSEKNHTEICKKCGMGSSCIYM